MFYIPFTIIAMIIWLHIGGAISTGEIDFTTRTVSGNFTVSWSNSPIAFIFWLTLHVAFASLISYFPIMALIEYLTRKNQ